MSMKNPFGTRIGLTIKDLVKKLNTCFTHVNIDITVNQMVILNLVDNNEGLIQHSIAEILNKDKSAVLRQIKCLEKKHYIIRVPDASDRRRKTLVLTKPGLEILHKAQNKENEVLEAILGNIPDNELNVFYKVLEKIHTNTLEFNIC